MSATAPRAPLARQARQLVDGLQSRFVERLSETAASAGMEGTFEPIDWLRDGGVHGGGRRFVFADTAADTAAFDRASLNVSAVHYDDLPNKRLSSATALSCIVHPKPPRAPSMHMHISWTELRSGEGYWRVMADLNPSHPSATDAERFGAAIAGAVGTHWPHGRAQGDRYFHIPALQRHRGVVHFYLEGHNSGDWSADAALAQAMVLAVIDAYCDIIGDVFRAALTPTDDELATQRRYHSLYFLQVLTLDRGTTSGLLIHGDNDVGILGSLPSTLDRDQLLAWVDCQPVPQGELLSRLIAVLPPGAHPRIDTDTKKRLADVVRAHYRAHPDALALQARGDRVPPTVANHRG